MTAFTSSQVAFAEALSRLAYCNPFLPERIAHERDALGAEFVESAAEWNIHPEFSTAQPNVVALVSRAEQVLRDVVAAGAGRGRGESAARKTGDAHAGLYEDLVLFVLYHRYRALMDTYLEPTTGVVSSQRVEIYEAFESDVRKLAIPGARRLTPAEAAHVFACFFQIRRAFHQIFRNIIGVSRPAARFRAAVWQSIFTHDMRRYRRVLYDRMNDFTTLITGPSGTGKELAARAVGLSRYVPLDPRTRAFEDSGGSFEAVNLSALSPTIIESELFGHRRGAFTGAVTDRAGWLEVCGPRGAVFLDEIGDLDAAIQLKLLRVLQSRTFQRLGDTKERRFHGKIIAATNRDLAEQRGSGRFRDDFYYRLCSDMIAAPSLDERLRDTPDELGHLVLFIARRLVGEEGERLAGEVMERIEGDLGRSYPWPGNVRELEQCVRNVLIRREYRPASAGSRSGSAAANPEMDMPARDSQPVRSVPARETDGEAFIQKVREANMTADELLRQYCRLAYAKYGSYVETARRLDVDRRTVKALVAGE